MKPFRNVEVSSRRHDELMAGMQRFRGKVYTDDGAIRPDELTGDGRHKVAVDDHSWHVLSLDQNGAICACLRFLEENFAANFDDLWVRHAAMAHSPLSWQFRQAVEREMSYARQMRMGFGEVGGWAVAEDRRGTLEPLRIILATYGLLGLLGGCLGVATATFRHQSTTILRRIGLASLCAEGSELPPYFDPYYGCQMEVLRFDSRFPNPKYRDWIADLSLHLSNSPVICREGFRTSRGFFRGFEIAASDPARMPDLSPVR